VRPLCTFHDRRILNPYLLTPLTPVVAIERVYNVGHLPIIRSEVLFLPPVGSSVVSTAREPVKRLPSSSLGGIQTYPYILSPVSSAHSFDSSSATDSEVESLTGDTRSDSASSISSNDHGTYEN